MSRRRDQRAVAATTAVSTRPRTVDTLRPMLSVTDLSKSYNGRPALQQLTLSAEAGEILGLLGPNGAGKTTFTSLVAGLLSPDTGQINIARLGSPRDSSVRRSIGVAPQSIALYQELTARENLRLFGRLAGLGGERLRDRVNEALESVTLTDRADDRVETFSGGMRRRLNLAAALVHDPPLLLLDEPTVGVDPQSRNVLFERVEQLRDRGKTVVLATHYMEEAQRLCDRVAIIDHGQLLAVGTVDQLIDQHGGNSVVTVTGPDGERRVESSDPFGEIARLQKSGEIESLRVDRPNLERVFLHLTGQAVRD